ncbi:MAG: aldose 1-epimerase family protein [Verrucomicrobia bacterium]|nr:aldose 1-epimerase family protein [Verrucomicrobiota bacterium]
MKPEITDHSVVLTDAVRNTSVKEWKISAENLGGEWSKTDWSITKRVLVGGRQDGVEVIDVFNGVMTFRVVPTRGFNIWSANVGETRLGWDSPVTEIVHPKYVQLSERGGLGWLNGFGEMLSRCGLESFGPPCDDSGRVYTLHGRINYIPASYVEVRLELVQRPRIVLRGIVDETLMFGPQLRLTAEISTELDAPSLVLEDVVTNLSDQPQEMQSLYHANFGPPLLGPGAQFVGPVKRVTPRNARAAEGGMSGWNQYTGPHGGEYTEQVYMMELFGDEAGMTEAMLKSADGSKAVVVSFNLEQLPFMTLWKNEGPAQSGYVTGLEPGTSYPHPKPFERAAGRVPKLAGGASHRAKVAFTVLTSREQVEKTAEEIRALQKAVPQVLTQPFTIS